jgi:putative membrane protein
MKRTLVLVVDRDDDYGVKGKVNTPVIGVQNCLDAATAFGIADPEDSDLNALYAAVSTCLELQEAGHDANVALICGDEKVGYRSDLALVSQLEEVMDEVQPDSVVLVGDGAEDEYIYPIISSRANVDSVRKVYVKQAPGMEGTFYIVSRMLSEPNKRKRFLLPIGLIITVIALIFLLPGLYVAWSEGGEARSYAALTGNLTVLVIGISIILYAYNALDKVTRFRSYVKGVMTSQSIKFIFTTIAIMVFFLCMLVTYYDVESTYSVDFLHLVMYVLSSLVWPATIAIFIYLLGLVIQNFGKERTVSGNIIVSFLNLVCISLVASGILDIVIQYTSTDGELTLGIIEIVAGVVGSILIAFFTNRLKAQSQGGEADEVSRVGADIPPHLRRHGLRPIGG